MDNDDLKSLECRVEQLEKRVEYLALQLGQSRDDGKAPQNTGLQTMNYLNKNRIHNLDEEKASNFKSELEISHPIQDDTPVDLERLLGKIWLPRIFIVVLLLGVMWGFNAAINAGLLNQPIRCILGAIVTVVLLYLGERQILRGRNPLGQVLLGGALSIGIFTVFAAHVLYHLIPATLAFPLDIILVICGVYLTYRHRSESLGILSSLGGYLIPFLIESHDPSTLFFVSYETILSVAFLLFSIWLRFQILSYVSIGLYQLALLAYIGYISTANRDILLGGIIIQHISLLLYYCFQKTTQVWRRASIYMSFVLLCCWAGALYSESQSTNLYFLFAIIYFILSIVLVVLKSTKSIVPIACATFALTLYILATPVVAFDSKNAILLVEGSLAIVVAMTIRDIVQFVIGAVVYAGGFLLLIAHPIVRVMSSYTLGWLIVMATLYLFYFFAGKYKLYKRESLKNITFILEATIILIFSTELTLAITRSMSMDVKHISLSVVWLIYAIIFIPVGIYFKHKPSRITGMILLFLTLCKLILIDVPEISMTVRALLFIVLGSVGVAISRLFYKKDTK